MLCYPISIYYTGCTLNVADSIFQYVMFLPEIYFYENEKNLYTINC